MRISDWSSDVCSSDLLVVRLFLAPDHVGGLVALEFGGQQLARERVQLLDADQRHVVGLALVHVFEQVVVDLARAQHDALCLLRVAGGVGDQVLETRSEEHTSELQSLMRISYAVFCLKKKKKKKR